MKNIKKLLDLDKIEVTEVLQNVLETKNEVLGNDERLIDRLINDYKTEHRKLILSVILTSMYEDDFYTDIMEEVKSNLDVMVKRIKRNLND